MKFFILFSVIALASADCDTEAVKKCDTLEKELAAKKFPQTKDELKSVCDKLFEGGKCLADLAPKCLKPNMLKLAQDILSAEKKVLTDTCSTGADQYIKDSKDCFNKPEVISGLEDIHKRYVGIVEASQGFDKSTYQQSFCCSQLYSLDTVYELNSNKCSKETADRLKAIATNTFGNIFHTKCGDPKSFNDCLSKMKPEIQSKFKSIADPKNPPPTNKNQFAVPTLIEMAKAIDN